jgi:outer membrane protein OmpA-like peptidoglycan-associated protein
MRLAVKPVAVLAAITAMSFLVACGGGKQMKLVVERETVIHDPVIQSVSVDGSSRVDTRAQGQSVSVRMVGDQGLDATFDVAGMFDGRAMSEGPSGVYTGSFDVPRGANGTLSVTGHLVHSPTGASATAKNGSAVELYVSAEPAPSGCTPAVARAFDEKLQGLAVHFELDRDEIPEAAKEELRAAADLLQSNPLCKIFVYGHTDKTGEDRYNKRLSALRAINVGRFLESIGVDNNRLEKHPMGAEKPVATGSSDEDEAMNRRVEIRAVVQYQ